MKSTCNAACCNAAKCYYIALYYAICHRDLRGVDGPTAY